ncbi:Uncharacterised protein [Bordetella pertussis]|nr:Uncharacterised protein [Bordetella pertussis]
MVYGLAMKQAGRCGRQANKRRDKVEPDRGSPLLSPL